MKLRSTVAPAAVTLGLLAATTGCTSAAKPTAAAPASPSASPTPKYAADFLKSLHDFGARDSSHHQRLLKGHTPDSVLLAAGLKSCAAHNWLVGTSVLVQEGWPEEDARLIAMTANFDQLCGDPLAAPSTGS